MPASFDEVARELTRRGGARGRACPSVTLLEEPQAAFYAWIDQSASAGRAPWTDEVAPGDLILVCDIGGGTTDFSLIAVAERRPAVEDLELHRVAVGEHILLGGDNMDLALAYHLRGKLEEAGHELDAWQFQALVHATREAKEKLLSDDTLAEAQVAVPSRGSSLFAKTVATTLARDDVVAILTEGYFPVTAASDLPAPRKSVGLQEYGLDYATEPAVSRHLARFLRRALENVRSDADLAARVGAAAASAPVELLRPTAVLFNGGVFEAPSFRARVVELLRAWFGADHALKELQSAGLDIAVSRGAAYYGAVRASARASRSRPVRPARTTSGSKARRRRFRATCRRSRVCASCPRARRKAPSSSCPTASSASSPARRCSSVSSLPRCGRVTASAPSSPTRGRRSMSCPASRSRCRG